MVKKNTKPEKIEKAFKPLEGFLNEVNLIVCEAQEDLGTLTLDLRVKQAGVKKLEKTV